MRKDLLLRLADHMEKVDAARYKQSAWLEVDILTEADVELGDSKPDLRFRSVILREGGCNTAACVFGNAPQALPEVGLQYFMEKVDAGLLEAGESLELPTFEIGIVTDLGEKGVRTLIGFDAAAHVFDISEDHAVVLFGMPFGKVVRAFYYGVPIENIQCIRVPKDEFQKKVTPAIVAQRLREYVATDGKIVDDLLTASFDIEQPSLHVTSD